MNRITALATTPLLRIFRFDHPDDAPHEDPAEEHSAWTSLSFVLRGSFSVALGSREYRLTPRNLFLTRPGLSYRAIHTERQPTDVCLSIDYAPEFFERASLDFDAEDPVVGLTNRSGFLKWRIERALAERAGDMTFEGIAAELLLSVKEIAPRGKIYPEGSFAWYAERVERARGIIETSYSQRHSLGSLAREAGMSPFHFARIFRELAGVPPARYLLVTRLERARSLLREDRAVTDAAYDCGFQSLSYFARAFRKRYGVRPSDIRPSRK